MTPEQEAALADAERAMCIAALKMAFAALIDYNAELKVRAMHVVSETLERMGTTDHLRLIEKLHRDESQL